MPDRAKPFSIAVNAVAQKPDIAHVLLAGFLDGHTVTEFERQMGATIQSGKSWFIIDMAELSHISSAGIGALMRIMQDLSPAGGDIVLLSPTQKVLEILRLLDFVKIFRIASSLDEAITLLECAS